MSKKTKVNTMPDLAAAFDQTKDIKLEDTKKPISMTRPQQKSRVMLLLPAEETVVLNQLVDTLKASSNSLSFSMSKAIRYALLSCNHEAVDQSILDRVIVGHSRRKNI